MMTYFIKLYITIILNCKVIYLFRELTTVNDLLIDKWSGTGWKTMGRV